MAHHRDISKAHAKFEGHGFHIEYHKEAIKAPQTKITRRSKNKCSYYNNGFCTYAHAFCSGVSCGAGLLRIY